MIDRPLGRSPLEWGLGSSADSSIALSRGSTRGMWVGWISIRISRMPIIHRADGASFRKRRLRDTAYTINQTPNLSGAHEEIPSISHDPLIRTDLRHRWTFGRRRWSATSTVPRLSSRTSTRDRARNHLSLYCGIGQQAQNVLLFDTDRFENTDVNEAGFTLTQRFYLRPTRVKPCKTPAREDEEDAQDDEEMQGLQVTQSAQIEQPANGCPAPTREWASWEIAQEFFIDPNFGGALIPGQAQRL